MKNLKLIAEVIVALAGIVIEYFPWRHRKK